MDITSMNRVLILRAGFWRTSVDNDGQPIAIYDQSKIYCLLEACIATGVERLAIPAWSGLAENVSYLPPALTDCIDIVDKDNEAVEKFRAFCGPIYEEFGSQLLITPSMPCARHEREIIDQELQGALHFFFTEVFEFFLGMEHKLQISTQPSRLQSITNDLLSYCRSPESRANLVRLMGILATYRQEAVDTLCFKSEASAAHVTHFLQLIEDEYYQKLSREAHLLSHGDLAARLAKVRRFAKKVVTRTPFKQLYSLAARIVAASQGLPVPEAEMLASLFGDPYLPPAAPLTYYSARSQLRGYDDVIHRGIVVHL